MEKTPRFLHKHPLHLFNLLRDGEVGIVAKPDGDLTCDHCHGELSGRVYACDRCDFYLHEACANLPREIQHSFHPCPLFLKLVPIPEGTERQEEMKIFYRCEACNFGLDDACALCQPGSCKEEKEEEGHLLCCRCDRPLKPKYYEEANAELRCQGCKARIMMEKCYFCKSCGYYLHEDCAYLPSKIQHFFHGCSLRLTIFHKLKCNVCQQKCSDTFGYYCKKCAFAMHVDCTQFSPITSGEEGILHWSHHHPLKKLTYEEEEADEETPNCRLCEKPILEEKSYACLSCGYYLHLSCANLPREIQHFFHSCPLSLGIRSYARCDACEQKCSNTLVYYCKKCNFDMHVECTQFSPLSSDEEAILHCSHHHPLRKLTYKEACEIPNCSGCQKPISEEKSYACLSCGFHLDLSCANMPREIQHFFHNHPLSIGIHSNAICDACEQDSSNTLVYYCKKCDFDMHVECTQFSPLSSDEEGILHCSHHHPLRKLTYEEAREIPNCSRCQKPISEEKSYACLSCGFHLDLSCANMPREIQHFFHNHPLSIGIHSNAICDACEQDSSNTLVYYCKKCDFDMHVECTQFSPLSSDEEGILHCSHHHPLRKLTYEEAREIPNCSRCQKPISEEKSYACLSCGFHLDLSCANMPREIQHFFHNHPLSIGIHSNAICDACEQDSSNTLVYYCKKCDFDMHVECTQFSPLSSDEEGILHCSHHHPLRKLTYEEAREIPNCSRCQKPISEEKSYACLSCGFHLDLSCANMPREIQHFFHDHPLSLKILDMAQCDACFNKCDGVFAYCCEKCKFFMHATCTQQYQCDDGGIEDLSHHHPLRLSQVAEKEDYLDCNLCVRRITCQEVYGACDLCEFHIHKSCMGRSPTTDKSVGYYPITNRDGQIRVGDTSHTSITGHFLYISEAAGDNVIEEHHQCHLCGIEILSPTAYATCRVAGCEFYIHKSCLGSPLKIQLPCHPCALSLGPRQRFDCNVCHAHKEAIPYRCQECLFYMDTDCAKSYQEADQSDQGDSDSILHFSHHHPLQLFKDPKRDKTDELLGRKLECLVCVGTASGWTYGCKWCGFYLHKNCLNILPQSISIGDCPFVLSRIQNYCRRCGNHISDWGFFPVTVQARPWCIPCGLREALSLWVSSSYILTQLHFHPCSLTLGLYPTFICNACFTNCHSHAYCCERCNFYVGIKCAQISKKNCHSETEKIQHFSHFHPLQLSQGAGISTTASCRICGILCLEASYFCADCNFHFHRSCLDTLPQKIDHHYLYCTLVLLTTSFYRCMVCQKENNSGLTFRSVERGFKLCMECVLQPRNRLNDNGSFTSIHHWHQLALLEELEKDDARCLLCREKCSTLAYYCNQCQDYFHKTCAEMPLEIHHPLHKQHHLTLISSLVHAESSRNCSLCLKDLLLSNDPQHSGVYRYECEEYSFQLDVKCAISTPSIQYQGHTHLLTIVENMQGEEECRVCFGSCQNNIVFRCTEVKKEKEVCNFTLHLTCGPLPCAIKHSSHVHALILEDFYVEENYTDKFPCHVCEERRDPKLPVYLCPKGCPMMCEIKCVISEVVPKLLGLHGEVELRTTFPNVASRVITKDEALTNTTYASKDGDSLDTQSTTALGMIFGEMRNSPINGIIRKWKSEMLRSQGIKIERADEDKKLFRFSKDAFQDFSSMFECTRLTLPGAGIPKFISQHDGPAVEGKYTLPHTLVPIYQELFDENGTITATFEQCPESKSFKSVFVFMLCAVVHNMRVTKLVDVTNERALQWLTLLKLVEHAGFDIGFIIDEIKLVWGAHFLIQSKALVDSTSEQLRIEIDQLSREEEELRRKLEETCKKKREMLEEQDRHYEYEKVGMKSLKKELKDVLLIKWKPASSGVIQSLPQQPDA